MEINGLSIGNGNPVRIMGIINLSPESFYEGSIETEEEGLRARIRSMEQQGADLIDVGAASTAPPKVYGNEPISENEELTRIEAVLDIILETTSLPISIDTTSAKVAKTALNLGAALVNDVSGLQADGNMGLLVAEWNVPIVLMASCPNGCQNIQMSLDVLRSSMKRAADAKIPDENIIIDPGIGFGKPPEVDFEILGNLYRFVELSKPLLVGVSRKAFLGSLLENPLPKNRLEGTIAATSIAVANGANIIRAHDIPEAIIASKVGESIRNAIG
jgi:dihydropteroate synthase